MGPPMRPWKRPGSAGSYFEPSAAAEAVTLYSVRFLEQKRVAAARAALEDQYGAGAPGAWPRRRPATAPLSDDGCGGLGGLLHELRNHFSAQYRLDGFKRSLRAEMDRRQVRTTVDLFGIVDTDGSLLVDASELEHMASLLGVQLRTDDAHTLVEMIGGGADEVTADRFEMWLDMADDDDAYATMVDEDAQKLLASEAALWDGDVRALTALFWALADNDRSGALQHDEYLELSLNFQRALHDGAPATTTPTTKKKKKTRGPAKKDASPPFDEAAALDIAERDWDDDRCGADRVDRRKFELSLLELAGAWADEEAKAIAKKVALKALKERRPKHPRLPEPHPTHDPRAVAASMKRTLQQILEMTSIVDPKSPKAEKRIWRWNMNEHQAHADNSDDDELMSADSASAAAAAATSRAQTSTKAGASATGEGNKPPPWPKSVLPATFLLESPPRTPDADRADESALWVERLFDDTVFVREDAGLSRARRRPQTPEPPPPSPHSCEQIFIDLLIPRATPAEHALEIGMRLRYRDALEASPREPIKILRPLRTPVPYTELEMEQPARALFAKEERPHVNKGAEDEPPPPAAAAPAPPPPQPKRRQLTMVFNKDIRRPGLSVEYDEPPVQEDGTFDPPRLAAEVVVPWEGPPPKAARPVARDPRLREKMRRRQPRLDVIGDARDLPPLSAPNLPPNQRRALDEMLAVPASRGTVGTAPVAKGSPPLSRQRFLPSLKLTAALDDDDDDDNNNGNHADHNFSSQNTRHRGAKKSRLVDGPRTRRRQLAASASSNFLFGAD